MMICIGIFKPELPLIGAGTEASKFNQFQADAFKILAFLLYTFTALQ